jgi:hypothetical protein
MSKQVKQQENKKTLKDFLCKPVDCKRRKIVQYEWYVRDHIEPEDGKPLVVAPWRSCNYVVDKDYALTQAERLRKRGHFVTFADDPAR